MRSDPAMEEAERARLRREYHERRQREPDRMREQERVRAAVRYAVRTGRLVRPERCPDCGRTCKVQAHHADYSAPLEVEWLCPSCHKREHLDAEA